MMTLLILYNYYLLTVFELVLSLCSLFSPPERHHWGRRDRPVLLSSLVHDENFHHLLFSQHHQQVALDESRQYTHTSTASRMLHPTAAHLPQQSPIMVDLHDQVTGWNWAGRYGKKKKKIYDLNRFAFTLLIVN